MPWTVGQATYWCAPVHLNRWHTYLVACTTHALCLVEKPRQCCCCWPVCKGATPPLHWLCPTRNHQHQLPCSPPAHSQGGSAHLCTQQALAKGVCSWSCCPSRHLQGLVGVGVLHAVLGSCFGRAAERVSLSGPALLTPGAASASAADRQESLSQRCCRQSVTDRST
jgi:hypothetical protein